MQTSAQRIAIRTQVIQGLLLDFKALLVQTARPAQLAQMAQLARLVPPVPTVPTDKQYVITHSQSPRKQIVQTCPLRLSEPRQCRPAGTPFAIQILIPATLHGTMRPNLNPLNCTCRGLNKPELTFTSF